MNGNDHFDELARRRLQEADFPFQEEDWDRMRALILAQRARRNRRIGFALALLLIGGTVTWWSTSDSAPDTGLAQHEHPPSSSVPVAADVPSTTPSQTAAPSGADSEATPVVVGRTSPDGDRSGSTDMQRSDVTTSPKGHERAAQEQPAPQAGQEAPVRSRNDRKITIGTEVATRTERSVEPRSEERKDGPGTSLVEQPKEEAPSAESTQVVAGTETTRKPEDVDPSGMEAFDTHTPDVVIATNEETSPKEEVADEQEPVAGTAPVMHPTDMDATGNDAPQEPDTMSMLLTDSTRPEDTLTSVAMDSALSARATPLTPFIAARAPWEITGWIGVQNNRTTYSGESSLAWKDGVSPQNTTTGGLEVMHMGKYFGLGAGLHYTTYAERLDVDALDRTSITYTPRWYLMPVDTVIFHVSAVLPGGLVEGYSIDTTIHVIQLTTDTGVVTDRVREARRMVNRVSYVEIPLLADLHLTQGRWSFGLRGGPTLGLLSARRGFLPAANGEDYSPLTEEPFSTLMWGYQATAYLRYRFHPAWAMGIGPGVRGQLGNSLDRNDLTRQAAAWNASISITYRLP